MTPTMWKVLDRDQAGVALLSAVLAVIVLTIVVAALAMATMTETGLSYAQSRGAQALHLAEAGAYRALAELRYRLRHPNQLAARVTFADGTLLRTWCQANRGQAWKVVAAFAGDPGEWQEDDGQRYAWLPLGSAAAPIEVRDAAGNVVGAWYATIYVRPADNSPGPGPNDCQPPPPYPPQYFRMPLDYFIVATGVTREARRTICLKSVANTAACGAWLAAPDKGDPRWDSDQGFPLVIGLRCYVCFASATLDTAFDATSPVWLVDTTVFSGPVHTNSRFAIWGTPTFRSTVSQVLPDVLFGNCGTPQLLAADSNPSCDRPAYQGAPLARGPADNVQVLNPPGDYSPFRAVIGDAPTTRPLQPSEAQVRSRTTDPAIDVAARNQTINGVRLPPGIYFMDECAAVTCGGIFVHGDVRNLVLQCTAMPCRAGLQEIVVVHADPAVPARKFVLLPGGTVRICPGGVAWTDAACVDTGKQWNGMLFVNGSVLSDPRDPRTGLYGTVHPDTRLTIAADGEIRVTNHLVYAQPPTGPTDPVANVLGLYAWCSSPRTGDPSSCDASNPRDDAPRARPRDVTVVGDMTPNDLYIDAGVLAPWGQFWVEGWNRLPDKGTLHFLGGATQKRFGEFGGFDPITGYGREMAFDQRFLYNTAPPFIPLTTQFTALLWPNMPDPRDRVDLLYDRPIWEELVRD